MSKPWKLQTGHAMPQEGVHIAGMRTPSDFVSTVETDSANYLTHYCAVVLTVTTYKLSLVL